MSRHAGGTQPKRGFLMNRNVRLIPAALVMVLLGACGPAEGNGNATPATGGNGKPSNSAIKATATPEGEWKPGGSASSRSRPVSDPCLSGSCLFF